MMTGSPASCAFTPACGPSAITSTLGWPRFFFAFDGRCAFASGAAAALLTARPVTFAPDRSDSTNIHSSARKPSLISVSVSSDMSDTVQPSPPARRYVTAAAVRSAVRVTRSLRSVPGVRAMTRATAVPRFLRGPRILRGPTAVPRSLLGGATAVPGALLRGVLAGRRAVTGLEGAGRRSAGRCRRGARRDAQGQLRGPDLDGGAVGQLGLRGTAAVDQRAVGRAEVYHDHANTGRPVRH